MVKSLSLSMELNTKFQDDDEAFVFIVFIPVSARGFALFRK